ncbi:MAG: DUF2332 domain-containing protein [Deltaproteobacteria bacterium]|nr:DUF2332 domain-containing protein [Deltaproteobacteria bacterium]
MDDNSTNRIASVYLTFAEREAHGRSALYETLARGVAADSVALSFLAELPRAKRQPNLLFAAMKYLYGTPKNWGNFRRLLLEHGDEIRATMMVRNTQTNEPARCATLLPLLAHLPPPLALLEVGAAAGLCLLSDTYAYDYDGYRVPPTLFTSATPPTFFCQAHRAPLPDRGLEIIWRAGLDLRPIDIKDPDQIAWLEALVWPDEGNRLQLLRDAVKIAQHYSLQVVQGDLRTDLRALVARMPEDATRVVFHTAVLGYLSSDDERSAFAQTVRNLDVVWISNEPPVLFPDMTQDLNEPWPFGLFLLSMNRRPIAWTDPHGASLDWISDFRNQR